MYVTIHLGCHEGRPHPMEERPPCMLHNTPRLPRGTSTHCGGEAFMYVTQYTQVATRDVNTLWRRGLHVCYTIHLGCQEGRQHTVEEGPPCMLQYTQAATICVCLSNTFFKIAVLIKGLQLDCEWCYVPDLQIPFWSSFNSIWLLLSHFSQCLNSFCQHVLVSLSPSANCTSLASQCTTLQPTFSSILFFYSFYQYLHIL